MCLKVCKFHALGVLYLVYSFALLCGIIFFSFEVTVLSSLVNSKALGHHKVGE